MIMEVHKNYRWEPLDYEKVTINIVNGIKNYCSSNNINKLVLGISGGLDSSVVAALVKLTGIHLIGVSMPSKSNEFDEHVSSLLIGEEFCDEYRTVELQDTFECVEKFCVKTSGLESTAISQGNIKARLRMIAMYDIASKVGGLVLDTDNLTEDLLGFFTKHGDENDLSPIAGLWKHEVYELAKYLLDHYFKDSEGLKAAINLVPTDGNGVCDGGDMAQIAPGCTYEVVDDILMKWVHLVPTLQEILFEKDFEYGEFKYYCDTYGKDIVKGIINRWVKTQFKRRFMPFMVDINSGDILERDGDPFSMFKPGLKEKK